MEACYLCGGPGAARIELRGISSRIIWFNIHTVQGPVCAGCAEAAYAILQQRTLVQGWWGPLSLILTLWNSVANVVNIRAHRAAAPYVLAGPQSIPRPQVHVRDSASPWVASIAAMAVLGLIIAIVLSPGSSAPRDVQTSMVDSCWSETSPNSLDEVACSSGDADYRVSNIVGDPSQCEDAYMDAPGGYACLKPW